MDTSDNHLRYRTQPKDHLETAQRVYNLGRLDLEPRQFTLKQLLIWVFWFNVVCSMVMSGLVFLVVGMAALLGMFAVAGFCVFGPIILLFLLFNAGVRDD